MAISKPTVDHCSLSQKETPDTPPQSQNKEEAEGDPTQTPLQSLAAGGEPEEGMEAGAKRARVEAEPTP